MAARVSGIAYGFQRVHAALQTGHVLTVQQQRQEPVRCFMQQSMLDGACGTHVLAMILVIFDLAKASAMHDMSQRKHGVAAAVWKAFGPKYFAGIYANEWAELVNSLALPLKLTAKYGATEHVDRHALDWLMRGELVALGYFHDIAMDRYDRMLRAQAAAKKSVEAQMSAAPSASMAEMEAETEGVPSESAPSAAAPQQSQATINEQIQAAQPVPGQTAAVPTLCSADETPVFACSTGKKRASLCMASSGSQLTYRLAPLDAAPEMVYPANAATASTAFKQGTHTGSTEQALPYVSFDKGNYRYVVYGRTTTEQGILVEQSGKRIADLHCQGERLSELGMSKMQSLSLNQDTRPLQLP